MKKTKTKLVLNSQSIRILADVNLSNVRGGEALPTSKNGCASVDVCPPG